VAPALDFARPPAPLLYEYALRIGRAVGYDNVGTVEFLVNPEHDRIYFIEVNPRIQVEHTVTEMITGVDLIKTQIYIASGHQLSDPEMGWGPTWCPCAWAMPCSAGDHRNPENDFKPDYGIIVAYRAAGGFGIRSTRARCTRAWWCRRFSTRCWSRFRPTRPTCTARLRKCCAASTNFRVRGVQTNISSQEHHWQRGLPAGKATRLDVIKDNPKRFKFEFRQDRAHAPAQLHRRRGGERQPRREKTCSTPRHSPRGPAGFPNFDHSAARAWHQAEAARAGPRRASPSGCAPSP
jgi:pyruvate carboxylase